MRSELQRLSQFVAAYRFWAALLLAANVAVWIAVEIAWRWWPPIDWWSVRMYLASGLLLFDNLCVLWWYSDSARTQAEASFEQLRLQTSLRREANKPIGFIDRKRVPDLERGPGEHVRYVIRNVAPGLAVNMFHVVYDGARCVIRPIGALEGNSERSLSEELEKPLRDRTCTGRIVIVAEGVPTRTDLWTATVNVLLPSGEIAHSIVWGEARRGHETLQSWVDRQWSKFNESMLYLEEQARL